MEYTNTRHNSKDCSQPPDHQKLGGFCFYKRGRKEQMNTKLIAASGIFMSLWMMSPTNAIAAQSICSNERTCILEAQTSCMQWCCKNGDTQTDYDCPTGWFYDEILDGCRRFGDSGSDSTGYYTQYYGTCAARATTYDCYEPANMATSISKCTRVNLPSALCADK